MILYKYYSYGAGISALKSSMLGFREPAEFNDPFELSNLDNAIGDEDKLRNLEDAIHELKRNVGVLSLTRTALNPLMWAHYGVDHTGFVIGYDVDTPFLIDRQFSLVTVDRGDVLYTSSKAPHTLTDETARLIYNLRINAVGFPFEEVDRDAMEIIMRKLFLTKHSSWVYEEEVRVIKRIFNLSEEGEGPEAEYFSSSTPYEDVAPGQCRERIRGLNVFHHPVRIAEVYLGLRNPLIYNRSPVSKGLGSVDSSLREKAVAQNWDVYALRMKSGTWQLEAEPAHHHDLTLRNNPKEGIIANMSGSEVLALSNVLGKHGAIGADQFCITNWRDEIHIRKNNDWII